MTAQVTHSAPSAAKRPRPASLEGHTDAELAEFAITAWNRWLVGLDREVRYRREIRATHARIDRLKARLRVQYAAAHSRKEPLLPSF